MASCKTDDDFVRLLGFSPFERRPRGGWRFGTKVITDRVVRRLIASGRAATDERQVWLLKPEAAE